MKCTYTVNKATNTKYDSTHTVDTLNEFNTKHTYIMLIKVIDIEYYIMFNFDARILTHGKVLNVKLKYT